MLSARQVQRGAVACCAGDPVRVRAARRGDACLFAPADARDAITVAASDLAHKFDGEAAGQSDAVYPARGPLWGCTAGYNQFAMRLSTIVCTGVFTARHGCMRSRAEQFGLGECAPPGPGCVAGLRAAERS